MCTPLYWNVPCTFPIGSQCKVLNGIARSFWVVMPPLLPLPQLAIKMVTVVVPGNKVQGPLPKICCGEINYQIT